MISVANGRAIRVQSWLIGLVSVGLSAPIAIAAPPKLPSGPTNYDDFIAKIGVFAGWMYGILMALGVVFLLYAAFLYLISQGSDERISTAKKVLIYAIVALVVGVLAGSISKLVQTWIAG